MATDIIYKGKKLTDEDVIDVLENVFIFKNTHDRFTQLDLDCINKLLEMYNEVKQSLSLCEGKLAKQQLKLKETISKSYIDKLLTEYMPKTNIHYPSDIKAFVDALKCSGRVDAYEELLQYEEQEK